ncbi:MAG: hypothetical protein K0R61_3959 [Microvirga sp.]|nr:hypothetical protein [Microvirga sp.]
MTAHALFSECGNAALALAREGWPVFPCDHRLARCKAPLTEHGFKDATTDPVQLEAWWRQFPNALIAVPTGEAIGAWVLDADFDPEKALDGRAELARLEAVRGRLPQTVEAVTPRGGRHLLFAWDPERPVTNSSGRLPDGLDVRGTGGYFIVWPSKREDGAEWRWETPPDFFDIAEAPAWLYELIGAKPERKPNGGNGGFGFRMQGGGVREQAWARAALEGCAADVTAAAKGKRNETLNACAYRLGRLIARGWLDRSEVELRLLAAAHACGLVGNDGERAARATLTSGLEAGIREPHEDLKDDETDTESTTEEADEEPRPPAFTDEALALRFADRHESDLRYVAAWGRWLRYDGRRWQFDETLHAFDLARRVCRQAAGECKKARVAGAIASAKTVAAVERLAKADRRLAATAQQWDADPWALNTPDGVVDLRTGEIRPHRPTDYLAKITAVGPRNTSCPLWKAHLKRILNDDADLTSYLQRVLGYALTGSTREHALFFAYGVGANGKSVTVNTVAGILADYAQTATIETFTASFADRHTTELAALRGARLVTASETEEGRRWAESRIKMLTGGDPIRARFMRQDEFEFQPQLKLLISGNHKPGLRSVDEAIKRRFHLIPFTLTIPPVERDADLTEKLKSEWPAILSWMIAGCLAWQQTRLNPPAAVRDATAAYLDAQDALAAWLEECCEQVASAFETRSALFDSWSAWATAAGEHVGTRARFLDALEARGFEPARTAGRGFRGLRIIPKPPTHHWSDR